MTSTSIEIESMRKAFMFITKHVSSMFITKKMVEGKVMKRGKVGGMKGFIFAVKILYL